MLEICCWSIYGILPAIKQNWRINGDLREINSYSMVTYWTYSEAHPSMDIYIYNGKIAESPLEIVVPSGNLLQFAIENGPVEIVDLPIKDGNVPSFFVTFIRG